MKPSVPALFVKRRELERALQAVPDFPDPDAATEQYMTPAPVAADLLWAAWTDGCIEGRRVLDLGCGTGIFALGASLLGAAQVTGVDGDQAAIDIARASVPDGTFVTARLEDWSPTAHDTVIMNPPFGAQKRHADRIFYERAAQAVASADDASVWFLAQTRTERFLAAYAKELGFGIERVADWDYPLPARFAFHEKVAATIHVGGYCLRR